MGIVSNDVLNADLASLSLLHSAVPFVGHELVVVDDVAVGKKLKLTPSVNICQSCSHEGLLNHHARSSRDCLHRKWRQGMLGTTHLRFEPSA
jgi:hypothetical protein